MTPDPPDPRDLPGMHDPADPQRRRVVESMLDDAPEVPRDLRARFSGIFHCDVDILVDDVDYWRGAAPVVVHDGAFLLLKVVDPTEEFPTWAVTMVRCDAEAWVDLLGEAAGDEAALREYVARSHAVPGDPPAPGSPAAVMRWALGEIVRLRALAGVGEPEAVTLFGPDGPEHGHTWEIAVRSRGSYRVVGDDAATDAPAWLDERPMRLLVRGWSLPGALWVAQDAPLDAWIDDEER